MFGRDKGRADVAVLPPPATGLAAAPEPQATESVLASTLTFKGEVSFQDAIRVEGEVEGRITGQGRVTVGRGGRVLGDIMAAEVIVHGTVQGNITAAAGLELAATAQVVGDLRATRLIVAEGAKMMGRLEVDAESISTGGSNGNGSAHAAPAPAAAGDALDKVL